MFKKTASKFIVFGAAIAALTGCGSYPLAPVAATGSKSMTLDMAQQGGSIVLKGAGYQTAAAASDVRYLSIHVVSYNGKQGTVSQTIGWPMSKDVSFNGLKGDTYTVRVDALDQSYGYLGGLTQEGIQVEEGKVTPLAMKINLKTNQPVLGGLDLGVTIEGDETPTTPPTPAPSATPGPVATPTPAPSATPAPVTAAFSDDFEGGLAKWQASWTKSSYSAATAATTNWTASTFAANGGSKGATPGDAAGQVTETGTYTLTLAGNANLSANTRSALRFDLSKFTAQYYFKTAKFQVDASADGGATWTQVYDQTASQTDWKRVEVDLSAYKTSTVKVRFRYTYDYYLGTDKMSAPVIDNVYLGAF
ncbi:MAG TPA: hypothetical protein V6D00_02015 [Pantanalinema sp.]